MKILVLIVLLLGLVLPSPGGETRQKIGSQPVLTRNYRVNAGALAAHVKQELPPRAGESDSARLIRYFKKHGIELKPAESIFLNEKAGLLFVQATPSHLARIEPLIFKFLENH